MSDNRTVEIQIDLFKKLRKNIEQLDQIHEKQHTFYNGMLNDLAFANEKLCERVEVLEDVLRELRYMKEKNKKNE